MRRRKFEFLTVLGLIAVLLSSTAGFATAPVAKDIPDIRSAVNGGGSTAIVLDLDDYVVDPDDRDQTTSAQLPLTWGENTSGDDNVAIQAGNELEVTVPASSAPESGATTFSIQDASADTVFTDPVTVKTADFLLGGPLVDSYLVVGGTETSPIPYSWCCDESKTLRIDGVTQSGSAGGRLYASVSSGIGSTCFISGSTILSGTDLTQPINPYEPGVTTRGVAAGSLATVSLQAANISVDADLNGMFVQCLAGFSDWVRVTVTRTYDSGAKDCYSVAVGDVLLGTTSSLSGATFGDSTIVGADEVYGFDNITLNDLIDASSAAAYEANPNFDNQSTAWLCTPIGQVGNTVTGSFGELSITSAVPASTYPGSNKDRALCVELDEADACGYLLQHKGIDPSNLSPGDVITLSINIYVDLNYGGSTSADEINEASNAPTIAIALGTQPGLEAVNYNFISFPLSQAQLANFAPGGAFPGDYGAGGSAVTNPVAGLHGKWTRHEVSLRIPESGVSYTGPGGTGNIAYPNGLTAMIAVARVDTGLNAHSQWIYLDNICITKTPGSLVLAEGATNVPMISAGWGFAGEDGNTFNATGVGSAVAGDPLPGSIARGEIIYGSFSDEAPTNDPTTVLGNAANNEYSQLGGNAAAGWLETLGNTDLAFIASGNTDVALAFPTLSSGNKALCLAADPGEVSNNYPNPNTTLGSTHANGVSVVTPYLDMRLAASAVTPALNINTVNFAAGTGGVNDQNSIPDNVSGVFGVRFFHHTNATNVAENPSLSVTLTNADETSGLVATRQANVLTTGNDGNYTGVVWLDDMVTGSVASFYSGQRYYDLVLNSGGGNSRFTSGGNSSLATSLQSGNPGAQLGLVQIIKGPSTTYLTHQNFEAAGFNAYQDAFGTGTTNDSALPGIIGTATVFVDEVSLHAVRDSGAFYDEDLCVLP